MGLRSKLLTTTFLLLSCALAFGERADETALLTLWGRHQQEGENHAALAQDALAFGQTYAQSPLAVVARGLAAWHLLKAGNIVEAKKVYAELAAGGVHPLATAGREMAFHWLTRFDCQTVETALKKVYAVNIEYPDTLSALSALPRDERPPMTDRWGESWVYKPAGFRKIDAGDKQTFELSSAKLGAVSQMKKALALPYGAGLALKPEKIMPPQAGKSVLQFSAGATRAALAEGNTAGNLSFPYMGEAIVVLSNGDYWFIEARPVN